MNCDHKKKSCFRRQCNCTNRSDTFLYDQSFRFQRSARFSYKSRHLFLLQLVTLSCTDRVFFIHKSSGVLTISRSVAEGYTSEYQWNLFYCGGQSKYPVYLLYFLGRVEPDPSQEKCRLRSDPLRGKSFVLPKPIGLPCLKYVTGPIPCYRILYFPESFPAAASSAHDSPEFTPGFQHGD